MTLRSGWAVALGAALLACGLAPDAQAVTRSATTVNGLAVYKYVWTDSAGKRRTVSIKRQGAGNPGNGGYAVQMTYFYQASNGQWRLRTANSNDPNEGFGYFVSHERFRTFQGGQQQSIARKIFDTSDSPLGKSFAATLTEIWSPNGRMGLDVATVYPRYGTTAPTSINPNTGQDDPPLDPNPNLYTRYDTPVSTRWYFQDGTDYPRIVVEMDLASVPGPDRISIDLRGPYGKIDFDESNGVIRRVAWADRFFFQNTTQPLTNSSQWTWKERNAKARFTSLTIGSNEMGLVEPTPYRLSAVNDTFSNGRGKTSATYACYFELPCDGEWPYQSAQYELPNNAGTPTNSEKIAWGSTSYFGTSLPSTYDGTVSVPFNGFPANKKLKYQVCLVLGQTVPGSLARAVADQAPNYNCAAGE